MFAPKIAASTTRFSIMRRLISMRVIASSLEQILSEQEVDNMSSCSYTAALALGESLRRQG